MTVEFRSARTSVTFRSQSSPAVSFSTGISVPSDVPGDGAALSDSDPADLGTAAPGVATEASRADHVHNMPAAALADLTDVDVVSDPPAQDDVLAWDDTGGKWTPATLSGGADLSDTTPQALGTAAPGVGTEASRADHVHAMPTAADVGAAAASHTHNGTQVTIDASGFNGNLTTSDDTVQKVAQKVDDLATGGGGIADPGGANDDFLQRKSGAWTYRTPAQVQADLGVSGHVAGTQSYLGVGVLSTTGSSGVLAAVNYEVYIPMFIPAGTYDAVGVRTTAAGTATWEIALYTANASGHPVTRLTSFGSIDMSVTPGRLLITSIELTITTSAWHFFGVKATAYTSNPTFWRMTTNHWPNGLLGWPIREDAAEGFSHLQKATGLASGALPATAPVVGTGTGELYYGQAAPRILLRKT